MDIDYKLIGKRIRNKRKQLHMTQAELAELADISATYISFIESGKKGLSLSCLLSICSALGTTMDYLITGTQAPFSTNYPRLDFLLDDCSAKEQELLLEFLLNAKELLQQYAREVDR